MVMVPVFARNGGNLSALEFDLAFDSQVLSCPTSVPSPAIPGELARDHVAVGVAEAGSVHVTVFSPSLAALRRSEGLAAQVLLEISPSAAPGSSCTLTLANAKACSGLGERSQLSLDNGTLSVGGPAVAPEEGQNRLVFPQVANGSAGSGGFYTLLALLNKTNASGRVRVRLRGNGGSDLVVRLLDGSTGGDFERDIPAGGSCLLQTDGQGTLAAGYAVVDSTVPVGGSGMFGWTAAGGRMVTEAGIGPSAAQSRFLVPVLYRKGVSSTGLALANSGNENKEIAFRLIDPAGGETGSNRVALAPQAHLACFVHETAMFPALAAQESFMGVLEITADASVRVTALKQSVQEGLITTLSLVGVE